MFMVSLDNNACIFCSSIKMAYQPAPPPYKYDPMAHGSAAEVTLFTQPPVGQQHVQATFTPEPPSVPAFKWKWHNLGLASVAIVFFPLVGIPAALAAILAYVDFRVNDYTGMRKKQRISWILSAIAFGIGILVMAGALMERSLLLKLQMTTTSPIPTAAIITPNTNHSMFFNSH